MKTKDYNHTGQEKILSIFKNALGYMACNLMENGKRKRKLVHRLVASAFISNPDKLKTVNHKNGVKDDNRITNLEWMTAEDNLKHSHKSGFVKYSSGEKHYAALLSSEEVFKVKALLSRGMKGRDIAKVFGVSEKYISAIKVGRSRAKELIRPTI